MAKYKVGDRVRIVKERTWDMSSYGDMDEYLGTIMTITFSPPKDEGNGYQMKEDSGEYSWTIGMIAGLANDKVELHDLIDQLDESEITEEQAWNKIAESYPANAKSLAVSFQHFYYEGFAKQTEKPEIQPVACAESERTTKLVEVPQMIGAYIKKERVKNTLGNIADEIYNSEESWSNLSEEYKWIRLNFTLFSRAWLDGYTIEKEPRWIVKRENGDYVDYFSGALYELNINVTSSLDATAPYKFTDKSKADAVALLIEGTVELIEGWKEDAENL